VNRIAVAPFGVEQDRTAVQILLPRPLRLEE